MLANTFCDVIKQRQHDTHLADIPDPTRAREGAAMGKNIWEGMNDPIRVAKATPAQAPGIIVGRKTPRERPTSDPARTRTYNATIAS